MRRRVVSVKSVPIIFGVLAMLFSAICLNAQVVAEFPPGGGNVAIVNLTNEDFLTPNLDFMSPDGQLVPIPGGAEASAAPFAFLLANTTRQVVYGSIGTTATFPAELLHVALGRSNSGSKGLLASHRRRCPD